MKLSKDLVPILRKEDIEKEAEKFLKIYCPDALKEPMAVPVEDIAEFDMGLQVDYVNLTEDNSTLGMMVFSDGVVEIYRKETDEYVTEEVKKGTMLIESDICESGNRGRERFTITHEMMHWDKHKLRFLALSYKDKSRAKACRCPEKKVSRARTPDEWLEWQADNLAAAVLMPKEIFKLKAKELKSKYYIGDIKKPRLGFTHDIIRDVIIDELAQTFNVSRQAASIRLDKLQIAV